MTKLFEKAAQIVQLAKTTVQCNTNSKVVKAKKLIRGWRSVGREEIVNAAQKQEKRLRQTFDKL